MTKGKNKGRLICPSSGDLRLARLCAQGVERMASRRSSLVPSDPLSLRVFGVFDPATVRVVAAFPTQYFARQYVRNSKRSLYIYCFDFACPLAPSLYRPGRFTQTQTQTKER